MRIRFYRDVLNVEFKELGVIAELQKNYLCTVYRPHSIMGERLGAFLYKDMTLNDFILKIQELSKL